MRIGPQALRSSLIGRMRERIMMEKGLLGNRSLVPMSNEVLDLFPDIKAEMERQATQQRQSPQGEVIETVPVR